MHTDLTFYILDVFAERRYAGNQLAVFRDAGRLSDDEMLQLAQEINYAETTFILSDQPRDGGYDVRIFMPAVEAPFAGHPTLGTAYIIQREIIGEAVDTVVLNLKVGPIPVTFGADGVLWMRQNPPTFGQTFDLQAVAAVLNLDPIDIDDHFPIEEVSTGLPFVVVPIKTLEAVRRARMNVEKLRRLLEGSEAFTTAIFCPEAVQSDNDIHVRVLEDVYNLPEDAATGSANGCIASYLVKHRFFGGDSIDLRSEQGYGMNRPSLLHLRAKQTAEHIEVNVGGRVVLVAKGTLVD